ncbi:V-type proton ATPase subunit C [Intoshia linei]|uniref:V-type proton ATPase subunit C n=1 Tax=Intoshia linei TaxID=1819745 RepID=A0A177BC93_9BILA|nr:V-type proton ATPase subunit C [Intoshia linei]
MVEKADELNNMKVESPQMKENAQDKDIIQIKPEIEDDTEKETDKKPANLFVGKIKFRNYKPKCLKLQACVMENLSLKNVYSEVLDFDMYDVQYFDNVLKNWNKNINFDNLLCNDEAWDIKKCLKKKLDKLEKRTQKSINILTRQELSKTDEMPNIYATMNYRNIISCFIHIVKKFEKYLEMDKCVFISIPSDKSASTLDILLSSSEELSNLSKFINNLYSEFIKCIDELSVEVNDVKKDQYKINGASIMNYISNFKWDTSRYPIKKSLDAMIHSLRDHSNQIHADFKKREQKFHSLKTLYTSLNRKKSGSLMTRSLHGIVKPENVIQNSDFMITLFVVVQRNNKDLWFKVYETMCKMIVPRSSSCLIENNEHSIFSVTLFKKCVDEFKSEARKLRFFTREFVYDEDAAINEIAELQTLLLEKQKLTMPFYRWLQVNYCDLTIDWLNVISLQLYTESHLRYGFLSNFQSMAIFYNHRYEKKVLEYLDMKYKHLSKDVNCKENEIDHMTDFVQNNDKFYPFVMIPFAANLY